MSVRQVILEIRPRTKQPVSSSNQKGMKGQKKYRVEGEEESTFLMGAHAQREIENA
jgi:hypothetical protein